MGKKPWVSHPQNVLFYGGMLQLSSNIAAIFCFNQGKAKQEVNKFLICITHLFIFVGPNTDLAGKDRNASKVPLKSVRRDFVRIQVKKPLENWNPRMWSAWHSDKVRCFVTQKTGDSTLEVKKALVEVEAWQPLVHVWWLLMYFCDILCCATIQQRLQRARSLCGNIQRLNVDWLLHVGTGRRSRRSFIFYELFMHTD